MRETVCTGGTKQAAGRSERVVAADVLRTTVRRVL